MRILCRSFPDVQAGEDTADVSTLAPFDGRGNCDHGTGRPPGEADTWCVNPVPLGPPVPPIDGPKTRYGAEKIVTYELAPT